MLKKEIIIKLAKLYKETRELEIMLNEKDRKEAMDLSYKKEREELYTLC